MISPGSPPAAGRIPPNVGDGSKPQGRTATLALALGNLGRLRWSRGHLDEAEHLLREAIPIVDAGRNILTASGLRIDLAALRALRGAPADAEVLLAVARSGFEEAGHPCGPLCDVVNAHIAAARARQSGSLPAAVTALLSAADRSDPVVRFLVDRLGG